VVEALVMPGRSASYDPHAMPAATAVVDVSILMPAYAAESTLEAALGCALAQRTSRAIEVVVIDDGSPDGTLDLARRLALKDPRVQVIGKENGGEASALNAGWRVARGRHVAIIEADVEPAPDWLETCLGVLEAEPEVWAVGGFLETPREDPWIARLAGYEIERKFASKPREAKHLTSANVLYRREAFEVAGPFDERLVNASLDSVFNGRLSRAGKRLVYEPRARVRHHYKTTLVGYLRRQWAYARYRVHNEVLDLYPSDRFLALHVALAAAGALATALAPFFFVLPPPFAALVLLGPTLLGLALLLQTPRAIALMIERRDPAALLYAPIVVARNVLGAVGYAVGLANKALGRA
jgi:glycosyltransferase involved in cell wall biosynthesis